MGRRDELAGILLRAADVYTCLVGVVERGEDIIPERAQVRALGAEGTRVSSSDQRYLAGLWAPFELPLLATAVEELHAVEAAVLQCPVGVRREPVVVSAVEHDRRLGSNARRCQQLAQGILGDQLTTWTVVQIIAPVPGDRAGNVARAVC